MKRLNKLKTTLEIMNGAEDFPQRYEKYIWIPIIRGIYWTVLIFIVLAFIGRSTKFIYIDF
ncbi:MAG: hypothetical protein AABZ06_07345 [Bdellovibrionota bacterium]